jgi:hypothetical protein
MSPGRAPEDVELENWEHELAALRAVLAQAELDLLTLRTDLASFEHEYLRAVGPLLAEIDEIEARLAQAAVLRHPGEPAYLHAAAEASTRAKQSASARVSAAALRARAVQRTDELKTLYREAAKQVHPDLAVGEEQRRHRTAWMARVNLAYETGDEASLGRILDEWRFSPDSVEGDAIGSKLVRVIRAIAQIKARLENIRQESEELQGSELFCLRQAATVARAEDRDLLGEIRATLESRREVARLKLERLEGTA